jgi:hypothetical protein
MRYLLLSIFAICSATAQTRVEIADRESNQPVSYASIAYRQTGMFADEQGVATLPVLASADTITIGGPGYLSRTLRFSEIESKEFLQPVQQLQEVIVVSQSLNAKFTAQKQKPVSHNDFMLAHMLIIGGEIAMYIPAPDKAKYSRLARISIPVVTKTIDFSADMIGKVQAVKRHEFATRYRLSFYVSENGMPGERIELPADLFVVLDQKKTVVDVDLTNHKVMIPSGGLFIGLTNLGPINEDGSFSPTEPYRLVTVRDEVRKLYQPIKPYFPVHFKSADKRTFVRFAFETDTDWQVFYKDGRKDDKTHNITPGYELHVY